MLRFVTIFAAVAVLAYAAPNTNIFEIDLDPEEAKKYIDNPPFSTPVLSGRTAVLPLVRWNDPRFRAAEAGPTLGHYWKNGREIENTDDYVEEVYDAAQYHGQDGLGSYGYGYKTPESAKEENRQRDGNVQGSYVYKSGNNDLIEVRYWADSQGFHQEDNLPKYQPEPVQETQAVREARLAHEKAWKEAADAALHPNAHLQGAPSTNQYDYQPQASEVQSSVVAPQGSEAREGKAYYAQAQSSFQQPQYQGQGQQYQAQQQFTTTTTEEPTGPPRGFFYSYTYPVSIIVPKSEAGAGAVNPGYPVDHDTVSQG